MRERSMKSGSIMSLAIVAFFVITAAGCAKKTDIPPPVTRSVKVAPASRVDLKVTVEYAARMGPVKQVAIVSKVPGRVSTVTADVGRPVRAGEVLFTLEPQDFESQYRQADAAYQSAEANLNRTTDSSLGQQTIQAQSSVDQAQVQFDDAKSLYDKNKKLYDGGVISKQTFDSIDAKFKSASIQLDAAKNSLKMLQDKSGPQSTQVVSAQADQAKAQADLAKSQLDNAVVRSPSDGVVFMRNVEPGELVGNSTIAFVVIDSRSVLAEADVPDTVVGTVTRGQKIDAVIPTLGTDPLEGIVDSISPAADPRTGLYAVKIKFANPTGGIKAGMLARVRFPVKTAAGVLAVPNSAVFTDAGSEYVFIAENGVARKRQVEIGMADASDTEITQGVSEGDFAVVDGQSFLNDGDRIAIAP
jgi:HlyD family secretion protein